MTYDSIIIGAGPAGCAAAVQLRRSGHNILMIEKDRVGGLLRNAWRVENYLGFPDGISGKELVALMEAQIKRFGIEIKKAEVTEVVREGDVFKVKTSEESLSAKTVIVATGTVPKRVESTGEEYITPSGMNSAGRGLKPAVNIFYHVGDIPIPSEDKRIVVVGGGDTAFDSAISLHEKGYKPIIITRSEACCLPLLKDEAEARDIEVIKSEDSFEDSDCPVLVAIGRDPAMLKMPEEGNGLFLVGDVKNGLQRHVHVAAGDGLRVALETQKIVEEGKVKNRR